MLLNDKVSFRMHWPSCPDLRINGTMLSISHSMIKDSVLFFSFLELTCLLSCSGVWIVEVLVPLNLQYVVLELKNKTSTVNLFASFKGSWWMKMNSGCKLLFMMERLQL